MTNNIASERVRVGLSQEELAAQIGVSRELVKKWEAGTAQPRASKLLAMGDLFRCSLDYLLGRTEERAIH